MKKCPYCSEEIQDTAVKCKHCNEWLNKKNVFGDFLSKTTYFVKQQVQDYKDKKNSHLYFPTHERPLEIDSLKIYPDRLESNQGTYLFKDIIHLEFHAGSSTLNFITVDLDTDFYIHLKDTDSPKKNKLVKVMSFRDNDTLLKRNISSKSKEQIALFYKYLAEITFKQRLTYYLDDIVNMGFFFYKGIEPSLTKDYVFKIYANGDLYKDDEKRGNIIQAYNDELLEWGVYRNGLKYSSSDPFEFVIHKSKGLSLNLFGFSKTSLTTTLDHDIFTVLMFSLVKYGNFNHVK